MNVIYSLSTLPFFKKHSYETGFSLPRFELYTAVISSLVRRRAGDTTTIHCDTKGAEYLRNLGITDVWNAVKVTIPDDLDGINPLMFWAAGKLFALRETPCPLLMLDTDFIAWHLPELSAAKLVAAHREDLSPDTYPALSHFRMNGGYVFDGRFDYSVMPLNTAFLYIDDDGFKQYYVEQAMAFMKAADDCDDFLTYMVYAEQRLLAVLAEYKKISVRTILEHPRQPQKSYTHVWGAKQVLRDNPDENRRFCERCKNRIKQDFPEWIYVIERIESHETTVD